MCLQIFTLRLETLHEVLKCYVVSRGVLHKKIFLYMRLHLRKSSFVGENWIWNIFTIDLVNSETSIRYALFEKYSFACLFTFFYVCFGFSRDKESSEKFSIIGPREGQISSIGLFKFARKLSHATWVVTRKTDFSWKVGWTKEKVKPLMRSIIGFSHSN